METTKNKSASDNDGIETLIDMLTDLNSRVQRENKLSCLSKDEYDQLYGQFKTLDQNIFSHKDLSLDSNDRLEQLVDIMSSMADLDFSREATVREEYNHLDYIAISLNMMRERLEQRVYEMRRMSNVIDSFTDLYLITDLDGIIIRSNKVLSNHYGIEEREVIGMHIKSFFDLNKIRKNYGLHFERDRIIHEIRQGIVKNENSDVVLRIAGKVYHNDAGDEDGYCYRVEPVSKKLYKTSVEKSNAEIIASLQEVINNMNREVAKSNEQKEILRDIQQTYSDKNDLTFMETMILNSINDQLNKD